MYYTEKKTENYRITEKKYVMPNGMFCLKNTDIQTRNKNVMKK